MKFTQVTGQKFFRKWTTWKSGDSVVGKLISTSTDNYGKPNYDIEVIECDFQGEIEPAVGDVMSLNANGSLDKAMETISTGDIFKVVYSGKDVLKKGKYAGKEFHKLSVYRADVGSQPVQETQEDSLDSL
jgi:hypothetical protein